MKPSVSLLIPCFNAAAHLPALLADAHAARHHIAEIIVYDDASTDDTAAVAERLGARVLRATVNRGVSHARNRLLEAAGGEYIHLHDADDRLEPGFFDQLLPAARSDRVAFGDYATVTPDEKIRHDIRYAAPDGDNWTLFFIRIHVPLDCTLIPRALLPQDSRFPEDMRLAEDRLFHVELAARGIPFAHVPGIVARAVQTPDSLSRSAARAFARSHEHEFLARSERLLPPEAGDCRRELGRQWLSIALGHRLDDRPDQAELALAHARRLGCRRFHEGALSLRLISGLLGPRAAFRYALWRRNASLRHPPQIQ